jgi:hypothetical protein
VQEKKRENHRNRKKYFGSQFRAESFFSRFFVILSGADGATLPDPLDAVPLLAAF